MSNKEQYAAFCKQHPEMPVMMQPWWLEAVCAGKEWDVMLIMRSEVRSKKSEVSNPEAENEVVAAMPYLLRKRLWYRFILMPQMTQFGGIWLNSEVQASPDMQERLAKLIAKRLRTMHIAYYYQKYAVGNPMPHWLSKRGMKIEERVTYRIDNLTDIAAVEESFSKNKKRQIERARELSIDYGMSPEEFYRFHTECMGERNHKLTYSREFLLVLERKTRRAGQSAIIRISERQADNDMRTVAAAFVVWDKRYMYYLIPAYLPSAAETGASARLAAEAIRLAKEKGLQFDFEGGNDNEGVANHYRQFGSKAVNYYSVSRLYRPSFALMLWVNKWWEKRRY
ncbi:MAG: GNAT family N-acetyltransferase [Paludibacteraceae bacterium]|nr:GNAT family N-acetyltransferase [Paludibacteraceae bacterium]